MRDSMFSKSFSSVTPTAPFSLTCSSLFLFITADLSIEDSIESPDDDDEEEFSVPFKLITFKSFACKIDVVVVVVGGGGCGCGCGVFGCCGGGGCGGGGGV